MDASTKKAIVVIVGPTAVGKTAIAIDLASHFKTEIISADSRQIYKQLDIGTAKPTKEELAIAKHHFIDYKEPWEEFAAGDFEREALDKIAKIHSQKDLAIVCGGSGLYIDALCEGFDEMPAVDPNIRASLNQRLGTEGLKTLASELKARDPEYFAVVDEQNPRRVIRALEIIEATQRPFSSYRKKTAASRPFGIHKIGLELDREQLFRRINDRVDEMVSQGLFAEAEAMREYQHLNALQTVGYQEVFSFLDGNCTKEEAIELIKRNSRRYAKRQLTWFKRDENITWLAPDQGQIRQTVSVLLS